MNTTNNIHSCPMCKAIYAGYQNCPKVQCRVVARLKAILLVEGIDRFKIGVINLVKNDMMMENRLDIHNTIKAEFPNEYKQIEHLLVLL